MGAVTGPAEVVRAASCVRAEPGALAATGTTPSRPATAAAAIRRALRRMKSPVMRGEYPSMVTGRAFPGQLGAPLGPDSTGHPYRGHWGIWSRRASRGLPL